MQRPKEKYTELDIIEEEGEAEYLDNGGAMDVVRRDHYFTRVADYARRLEDKLDHLGQLAYLNEKRRERNRSD